MWIRLLVLMLCVGGCSVCEAQHADSNTLRQRVVQVRSQIESLRVRRRSQQKILGQVADRIEQEKRSRGNKWFVDSKLYQLLAKSQEISLRITELVRAENRVLEELKAQKRQLAEQLASEAEQLQKQLKQAQGKERWKLVSKIRTLSAERSKMLEVAPVTVGPLVANKPEEDPEKLRELADAFLDYEDKLRHEERVLSQRIEVLEKERDLERRMGEMMEEDSLWGESDRRIAIRRQAPSPNDRESTPVLSMPSPEPSMDSAMDSPEAQETATTQETSPANQATPPDSFSVETDEQKYLVNEPSSFSNKWTTFSDDENLEQLINRRSKVHQLAKEARKKAKEIQSKAKALSSHE